MKEGVPNNPGKSYVMGNEGKFVEASEKEPVIEEITTLTSGEYLKLVNDLKLKGWVVNAENSNYTKLYMPPSKNNESTGGGAYATNYSAIQPPDFIKVLAPHENKN